MAVAARLTKPCTIIHVDTDTTTTDDDGNLVHPETETATVCYYEQVTRWDETIGQNIQLDEWLIMVGIEETLTGYDRIVIDGSRYEMFGPPWPVWNPRINVHTHIQCRAKRTF